MQALSSVEAKKVKLGGGVGVIICLGFYRWCILEKHKKSLLKNEAGFQFIFICC